MSEDQEKDEFFDEPRNWNDSGRQEEGNKKQSKKGKRILAVVLAVVLLAIGFSAGWLVRWYLIDEDMRAFLWALDMTEKYYYLEIDEDAVYANAASDSAEDLMASLESQLDAYSCFYTKEEYAAVIAAGAGQNKGIGVSIYDAETGNGKALRIALVVENSPAQKAGVKKGMFILGFGASEEELVSGDMTAFSEFVSAQNGLFYLRVGFHEDGSDAVTLALQRESYQAAYCYYRDSETSYSFRGESAALYFTETYSPIEGLDDSTAYIRIDEFSGNAAEEFAACLSLMADRGRTNLILDLRTNGGGYLEILRSIAAHLMKDATETYPIVATAHYRNGFVQKYKATEPNDYDSYFTEDSQIWLLADEDTASASECLIGSMVDWGTISYDHVFLCDSDGSGFASTFGKGIMQSSYTGALGTMKLTVATICWPVTGNCIHGVGVTTDDGAHGICADLFWGEEDVMLNEVVSRVCSA